MRYWIIGNMTAGILGTIIIILAKADPAVVQKAVFGWFLFEVMAVIVPGYAYCSPLPSGVYPYTRSRALEGVLLVTHLVVLVVLFACAALYVRRAIG